MRVYQRSVTDAGVLISGCKHVRIQGGRVRSLPTATTATAGIQGDSGSNVYVTGMDFYGSWRAFRCNSGAQGISVNNKGDCRLGVDGAVMIAYGTQPCDQSTFAYASANGGIIHQTGVTVDMGTSTPPEPETVTATFAATTMRTINGDAEWPGTWMSAQNYALQGYTTGAKRMASIIWFSGLSALSGKTILSAKLTIRRILPTGRNGGIKVIGYYGALSNVAGSGAPSSRVSIGTLGLLELPQTGTFDIPPAAISYLAGDSTGRCLALNPKDSALWNGEPYSENHARFAGVGTAYVPELEVTYVP